MHPPGRRDAKQGRPDPRLQLDALEDAIEELRVAYEKYFCGVDRMAPTQLRDRVERQLREFLGMQLTQTAMRFRLHGLKARLTTYKHYWTRIENEMERGIYRRDVLRAARRQPSPQTPSATTRPTEPNPSEAGGEHAAPAAAANGAPRPNAKPTPMPTPEDAGLDAKHLREVFKQLVAAKRKAGESTDGLTYAALVRKLSREAPRLREKSQGAAVRFEVATVEGRVRLRAKATSPVPGGVGRGEVA